MRRVVVTGIGIVSSIGNNADACNNANVGDDSVLSLTFVLPSP